MDVATPISSHKITSDSSFEMLSVSLFVETIKPLTKGSGSLSVVLFVVSVFFSEDELSLRRNGGVCSGSSANPFSG